MADSVAGADSDDGGTLDELGGLADSEASRSAKPEDGTLARLR